jgi:cellulose biosynthesis protein BcsQ
MAGSITTFYSFKGGVGRSFAVANVATILAQWGSKVLVVDWDIEAPGLNHYFAQYAAPMLAGVLDFIEDSAHEQPRAWSEYATRVSIPQASGELRIMPAGAQDADYTARVQQLDWDNLFRKHRFGTRLETLRAGWVKDLDIVLLDSRTGVTDFSGLTTAQLPDVLAFMFTANRQSLHGCTDIAQRAMEARRSLPIDRPALLPLPIPGRFEQREEYDRAQEWRALFARELNPFFDTWAPPNTDYLKLIDLLSIPYVPRWAFGEELAALIELPGSSGTRSPNHSATYALETLAALLLQRFANIDLLVSSRDEYVHGARSLATTRRSGQQEPVRVLFSYSHDDKSAPELIYRIIEASSGIIEPVMDLKEPWANVSQEQIERADACITIVGPSFDRSSWQQRETQSFLRQALRSSKRKPIIPVVLEDGKDAFSSSKLADYHAVFVDNNPDSQQIDSIVARLNQLRPSV